MSKPVPISEDQHLSFGDKPITNMDDLTNRIGALAVRRSIQRLEDGTASSAEVIYWLNQTSPKTQLERQKLEAEAKLVQAKIDALEATKNSQADYAAALKAFKSYSPTQIDGGVEDADFKEL